MFRSKNPKVEISIPEKVLEAIFDECDRHDVDETGGRLVGTYQKKGKGYDINVLGVIGPGPNAKRSPTSFFQDGEYQERIFRALEEEHPEIEHLGNWHTHHVNGLMTLSSGDHNTYHNVVNHVKHNTDFFYALLVVRKSPNQNRRYETKHFVVFRNDHAVYEIPASQIRVKQQSQCPRASAEGSVDPPSLHEADVVLDANLERVKDQTFFSEFFPSIQPGLSKTLGTFYWKGHLPAIDGSRADVLVMESTGEGKPSYSIALTGTKHAVSDALSGYESRSFSSARAAVLNLERNINRELYRGKKE
jgi:proteasome lid subunit RPN8/RPN11